MCYMRGCWNRQTGTFEVRVSNGVGVQVPSLAPKIQGRRMPTLYFLCSVGGLNPPKRLCRFTGFACSNYDKYLCAAKPGFKVPRAAGLASADAHKLGAKPGLKVPSLAPSPPYGMVDAMAPYGVFIFGDRVSVFLSRNPFVYML